MAVRSDRRHGWVIGAYTSVMTCSTCRIDPTCITQLAQKKFTAKLLSDYRHDPTNPECTARKHCVYSEWMVGDAVEQHSYAMPAYLRRVPQAHEACLDTLEVEQCSHCSEHPVLCYPLQ
jgi:hypothetical protein